jgi:cyanophycinase
MTKEMWQVFFDIDAELWFHFTRDSLGNLMGLHKRTHQFIDAKTSDS